MGCPDDPRSRPRLWPILVPLPLMFATPAPPGDAALPFNSDGHRLLGDLGAALVELPAGVTLPPQVAFGQPSRDQYLSLFRAAKTTAVGFGSNNAAEYDKWAVAQDNCYWTGFGQRQYNLKINIPDQHPGPAKVLTVTAWTASGAGTAFTFGELVSIYGDYRRTVSCAREKCFLTHGDAAYLVFGHGTRLYRKYCPARLQSTDYLRRIGGGLVPPFGSLGNPTDNTAGDREYGEAGWWGDEMLRIANVNDWHFSKVAIAWYVGAHRRALVQVDSARANPVHWIKALHHEANALHSLTDLFAFGHVVTNRDQSSYGIMRDRGLAGSPTYRWMERTVAMGGGIRSVDTNGSVELTTPLVAIDDDPAPRDALLLSYRGNWVRWAYNERRYHDEFNRTGAWVKNLNGDRFYIYGDGELKSMWNSSQGRGAEVATQAVRWSLQRLFEAYEALEGGETVAELGQAGSRYFDALRYVPIYVESDPNQYFLGRWALYAKGVDDLVGAGRVPEDWDRCKIPVLTGYALRWPAKQETRCATY